MDALQELVLAWIERSRTRLTAGSLAGEDLDRLQEAVGAVGNLRQRLLYLHTRDPSVRSEVQAWAEHPGEDPGGVPPVRPYATVSAAIEDGWRVIHFPQQSAPFDDREVDIAGFEFILEKLERVNG